MFWIARGFAVVAISTGSVFAAAAQDTIVIGTVGGGPYRKSDPDILMVQSTEDGPWLDASDCVHRAQIWRVLRQR